MDQTLRPTVAEWFSNTVIHEEDEAVVDTTNIVKMLQNLLETAHDEMYRQDSRLHTASLMGINVIVYPA